MASQHTMLANIHGTYFDPTETGQFRTLMNKVENNIAKSVTLTDMAGEIIKRMRLRRKRDRRLLKEYADRAKQEA